MHYYSITAVSCGLLDSPKNGRVSFTGITINSVAKYSCFQGYDVVGETTRTCQKNGQWSGHEPFCKGMCYMCIHVDNSEC